jgi:hypothetical protein
MNFYKQLDTFICMIISHACDLHLGQKKFNLMNIRNQQNYQEFFFFLVALSKLIM